MPTIIDFGIAKATAQKLTERTLFTELGALIGTPDAFVVTVDGIDGAIVRFESWMYHEAATQIDFREVLQAAGDGASEIKGRPTRAPIRRRGRALSENDTVMLAVTVGIDLM